MSSLNTRNYGDTDSVAADVKTLHDIIARQGSHLLTACLAEHLGNVAIKFDMSFNGSKRVLDAMVRDLEEQAYERI